MKRKKLISLEPGLPIQTLSGPLCRLQPLPYLYSPWLMPITHHLQHICTFWRNPPRNQKLHHLTGNQGDEAAAHPPGKCSKSKGGRVSWRDFQPFLSHSTLTWHLYCQGAPLTRHTMLLEGGTYFPNRPTHTWLLPKFLWHNLQTIHGTLVENAALRSSQVPQIYLILSLILL